MHLTIKHILLLGAIAVLVIKIHFYFSYSYSEDTFDLQRSLILVSWFYNSFS